MTIGTKLLLAAVFVAVGFSVFWVAEKQGEVAFSELEACQKQCAGEKKTGQLVPFSSTQITKRGDFTGAIEMPTRLTPSPNSLFERDRRKAAAPQFKRYALTPKART